MQKKTKQKRGVMRRMGDFVVLASGWPLIAMGAGIIYRSWLQISERDRKVIPNDTWAAACARHGVTPVELQQIMKELLVIKRTYMLCAAGCIYIAGLAAYLMISDDFSLARLNMLIGGIGGASVCFAYVFKHSFRRWQCEIKRLDGIREFFADSGLKRMLNW